MRIGVFYARTDPALGGGYTFEHSLVRRLIAVPPSTDHELVLIGPPGDLNESARATGMMVIDWPPSRGRRVAMEVRSRTRRGGSVSAVDSELEAHGIQLVWSLGPSVPTFQIPFVVTVWDLQHVHQPWFPEVSRDGEWQRRERHYSMALPRATRVVVGTEQGRREVRDYYRVPTDRIVIAPHPVPAWVTEVSIPKASPPPERPYVLYPAQLWPHKNHYHLLVGLQRAAEQGTVLDCVLVGSDGGNRDYLELVAADLGIRANLTFRGFVATEELARLYIQATAVVYLTLFGPENLPPLESMALGTPVIASRVEGAEEQFGEAALLVDPMDGLEIAHALTSVASNAGIRNDLIERGRRLAARRTVDDFIATVLGELDAFGAVRRCWP